MRMSATPAPAFQDRILSPRGPSFLSRSSHQHQETPAIVPEQLVVAVDELMDQRAAPGGRWQRLLQVQQDWGEEKVAVLAAWRPTQRPSNSASRRCGGEKRKSVPPACVGRPAAGGAGVGAHRRSRACRRGWSSTGRSGRHGARSCSPTSSAQAAGGARRTPGGGAHRRRHERCQDELARLAEERAHAEEARRQYGLLAGVRADAGLARQGRVLSSRALALERYRLELIQQSADSARAESRLGKLEKQERRRRRVRLARSSGSGGCCARNASTSTPWPAI